MPARLARVRGLTAGLRGAWIALGLALAAGGAAASASGDLDVGAAASLREVVEAAARAFEAEAPGVHVRAVYGASSALAAQLRAGAPLDLLLSADSRITDALAREGRVEPPRVFAHNRLVVMAAPGAPALREPADLVRPELRRLAVCGPAVPVGRYAREWLAARGLLAALDGRLVAPEHARAALVAVDQGLADAAIVYASDARVARRATLAFEVPAAEQPDIAYASAVLRDARRADAARAFAAFLTGERGRALLRDAGFGVGNAP